MGRCRQPAHPRRRLVLRVLRRAPLAAALVFGLVSAAAGERPRSRPPDRGEGSDPSSAADRAAAPESPSASERRPFVRVSKTRLMVGDDPFYFVGANLNVMHGPRARGQAAKTIAAAAADGLRVGRVWALGEGLADEPAWKARDYLFRAGPDGWQERAYLQLDRVIAAAAHYGLRLMITLSNSWGDYGGIPMYLRWTGRHDSGSYGYDDQFFSDPRAIRWYKEHVRRIVTRVNSVTGVPYREDPTIFAWELQNELHGTPEAAKARRAWVVEMARFIRKHDDKHLISSGLIGYSLELERKNWIRMCQLPEVSYCDQHIYPEEHVRSRGLRNLRRYVDDRVQLAHYVVGKPIIFGEFGFSDKPPAHRRAAWHLRFLRRVFYDGANGALVWIYQPTLPWKRRYGVMIDRRPYRRLRGVLARVARRVARRPVRGRNPRLGPEMGRQPLAPTHAMLRREARPHRGWHRWPRVVRRGHPWDDGEQRPAVPARGAQLQIPVDRFARAWFEEAGSWAGDVLVHAYGRRTGWFEYRFVGPPFVPRELSIEARLSSEYPGRVAPEHGVSRVEVLVDGKRVDTITVPPDDGIGRWVRVTLDDPRRLRGLRRGVHRLRFAVKHGRHANGVAIYGRETEMNREPVVRPEPITLIAHRAAP